MTQAEGLRVRKIAEPRSWYKEREGNESYYLLLTTEEHTMESLILAQNERQRQA